MAKEYTFAYWGVDVKRGRGRLQLDSERLLSLEGFSADVVDIDTYASPWKHWLALLPNVDRPVTVFLTEGICKVRGGTLAKTVVEGMGLIFPTLSLPNVLGAKLPRECFMRYMVALADKHGSKVKAIVESPNGNGSARYYGVRLEPAAGRPGSA